MFYEVDYKVFLGVQFIIVIVVLIIGCDNTSEFAEVTFHILFYFPIIYVRVLCE